MPMDSFSRCDACNAKLDIHNRWGDCPYGRPRVDFSDANGDHELCSACAGKLLSALYRDKEWIAQETMP